MKKIGLYFGSFNPIHVGHMIIANHIVEYTDLNQVWFIVTPHNPHKKKANLLNDTHRLSMVRIAVEENVNLIASNIEFDLPKPSYTVFTLQVLKEKHPDCTFSLIMGEDNIRTLHKWKNYEYILENHEIFVYPRVKTSQEEKILDNKLMELENVHLCDAPVMTVSSSFIRNAIKNKKDVRYLLTEPVFKFIDEMNFYR